MSENVGRDIFRLNCFLQFTCLSSLTRFQLWFYFRSVGYKSMSITLAFESDYFAEHIDGFENARNIYAAATTKIRKTLNLPSKVNTSLLLYYFTGLFRFIQLFIIAIKWKMLIFFFQKKIVPIQLWKKKLIIQKQINLMLLRNFWLMDPKCWILILLKTASDENDQVRSNQLCLYYYIIRSTWDTTRSSKNTAAWNTRPC